MWSCVNTATSSRLPKLEGLNFGFPRRFDFACTDACLSQLVLFFHLIAKNSDIYLAVKLYAVCVQGGKSQITVQLHITGLLVMVFPLAVQAPGAETNLDLAALLAS